MQTDETPSAEPAPAEEEAAAAAAMETQAEVRTLEQKAVKLLQIVSKNNLYGVFRERPPQRQR